GRPNVVAWLGESGRGPSLLLEGHTDVVTEGNPAEWTHAPFGAELVDGRIYGRGAADMKSGLAAAMVAAVAIKRSAAALNGRLVLGACGSRPAPTRPRWLSRSTPPVARRWPAVPGARFRGRP